jgi:hypothetical protein
VLVSLLRVGTKLKYLVIRCWRIWFLRFLSIACLDSNVAICVCMLEAFVECNLVYGCSTSVDQLREARLVHIVS